MIKALLFDFDGTLLNTNELIIQTFMHVLEKYFPGQFQPEDCLQFIGPSLKETFEKLDPHRADEMTAEYRTWNHAHHDELVKEYDGVLPALVQLKELDLRMAIVSTKMRKTIKRGLEIMNASQFFEVIVGIDDVQNVKPDPEPINLALSQLGLKKDEVIMIGDNYHDILAGKNAGVKTAGVAWAIKGEEFLKSFDPNYMLKTLSDLVEIVKELNNETNREV